MRRSLWIGLLASAIALGGNALAGDEWDEAYAPVKLGREARQSKEYAAPESHRRTAAAEEHAGLPVELSADTVGDYFGLGDEFSHGENYNGLGRLAYSRGGSSSGASAPSSPAHNHEWDDQPDGFGASHNHESHAGFASENVYGPMWGVPDDAVGLEGFSGNPYPGLIDGEFDASERSGNQPARSPGKVHEDSAGGKGSSAEEIQRNHRINRPGGYDD